MYGHQYPTVAMLFLGALVLGGCSSLQSAPQRDIQHEAVSRWTRCIERYSHHYTGQPTLAGKRATSHCEGHQRDVLATYPPHLQNQIGLLLSERAHRITSARVIKTANHVDLEAFKDSHLDTLKNRLMEAHQADL